MITQFMNTFPPLSDLSLFACDPRLSRPSFKGDNLNREGSKRPGIFLFLALSSPYDELDWP